MADSKIVDLQTFDELSDVELKAVVGGAGPRTQIAAITRQVIESGVDFIMGGGEIDSLPDGTVSFFGEEVVRI